MPLLAQSKRNLNDLSFNPQEAGIQTHRLYDDSLSSSFLIYVRDSVPEHFHRDHAEQVFILEGEAEMMLGEKQFRVIPGDIIYIPRNTTHKVKVLSSKPLKLLSFQAPFFDGKDRVFKKTY